METVLTAPAESETLTRIPNLPTKPTRRDKKVVQSSNGGPPTKSAIVPSTRTQVQDPSWESEGWRYIEKPSENGRVKYERVPLTRYELLHPQEDYIIVNTSAHDFNIACIGSSTKINLRDVLRARVLGDVRTDFNLAGVEPISPDISVMFNVSPDQIWRTFNCQEEGVYPSVVFEVTSPSTRQSDFGEKYDYYCQAGIPYYVILDVQYDWSSPIGIADYTLHLFERVGGQYEEMQANSEGRYWLPPLRMWVGTGDEGILCYDEAGKLLLTPEELARSLDETEERLDVAMARADEQERIAQEADARAAEQERLAEQEAARATEQERLAEQEAARAAEQERIAQEALQAQLAAEAKVAEVLAQMAELQSKL